ncbi:type I-E CRISPR-associated protein Cse2/CasB [Saccharothrix australiensis]|uniref:CRISPR-associated Cse2 family protein n=1 Tax=Saccharothrix australiensis TaxID=2072 RepID=A0A495VZG7_9PSEU|nr:type I-E CRISPR-associated protein Cse2/CasB [Saccharothrix australiensis]RKT54137.1 CRISPR-associated Cse2 family protein [Saccharothrix australiensis]
MTVTTAQPDKGDWRQRWATLTPVGVEVHALIQPLQEGVLADRAAAVAALARLRRGVGKPAGSVQEILQYTVSDAFAGPDAGDEPTPAETAAHVALTLYSLHQQSRNNRMHQRGFGLGRSLRMLHPTEFDTTIPPVLRRFQTLGSSQSLEELVHHLRGAVQLLRPAEIPLDYAALADDLLWWQRRGGASRVRLRWGREFFRTPRPADSADGDAPETREPEPDLD